MGKEQILIDDRPEIVANRQAGIILCKAFLYVFLLFMFFMSGATLGSGTVSYYRDIIFREEPENGLSSTPGSIWTWQLILLYISATILTIGAAYLAHKLQRKLSNKCYKYGRRLAWIDWCFTILNFIVFCYGVLFGYVAAMLSISMDYIP